MKQEITEAAEAAAAASAKAAAEAAAEAADDAVVDAAAAAARATRRVWPATRRAAAAAAADADLHQLRIEARLGGDPATAEAIDLWLAGERSIAVATTVGVAVAEVEERLDLAEFQDALREAGWSERQISRWFADSN